MVAAAVRGAYVVGATPRRLPIADPLGYHLQANAIAAGRGFVSPFLLAFGGRSVPTAAEVPLFPAVLSLASSLGGRGVVAHRLVGCLIGCLTVACLGAIGRRVAGPRCGLVAAWLGAVYPPLWVADGGLGTESLFALTTAACLLAALRHRRAPTLGSAAATGVALAAATLTRVEGLLLAPLLIVPLFAGRGGGTRRSVQSLAVAAITASILVAPWIGRNLVTFQRPELLSSGEGTLAGSNCGSAYYGPDAGMWLIGCVPPPPPGDESIGNAFWRRQALHYAREHAARVPAVMAIRVARVWQLYGPLQDAAANRDDGRPRWANLLALAGYAFVVPLAGVGADRLRREGCTTWALVSPLVLVTLTAAVVWGAVRFRAPAEPSLVVLAAVGVSGSRLNAHGIRAAGPGAAPAA